MGLRSKVWRVAVALSPWLLRGADAATGMRAVEVVIEQQKGDRWVAMDTRTVFDSGDLIRFRFQSDTAGFLYVLDRAPDGSQRWLFPSDEAGSHNEIEPNREYIIPTDGSSFGIPGNPGYDVVSWIVSPAPLPGMPGLPTQRELVPNLLPRCRPNLSHCVDGNAGPRGALRSRDLKVRATGRGPAPLIYEILLAHR